MFIEKLYNKLLNEVYVNTYSPRQKFRLAVSITTKCNLNCVGCLRKKVDNDKKIKCDLSLSVFELLLKEGKKINAEMVGFTGGEAIMHPDFEKMVALTEKYGYDYTIISNGWIHKEYIDIINRHKKNFLAVSISLDGATAEVHDSIRNRRGSFERALESIRFYLKNDIKVSASVCVSRKNFEQIEKIMDLCVSLKISRIRWLGYISIEKNDRNALSYSQRVEAVKKIFQFHKKFGSRCFSNIVTSLKPGDIFYNDFGSAYAVDYCPALNGNTIYLNHNGEMVFCCDSAVDLSQSPSIEKEGFEESFRIILDTANNLKKARLERAFHGEKFNEGLCNFCNENAQECLRKARENFQG